MFDAKYKSIYVNETLYSKIDDFWKWFELNIYDIQKAIKEQKKEIITLIETRIKEIYVDAKRGVPLALGFKDDMYHMYLYFGRSSYLLTIGDTVMNCMPKHLKNTWRCIVMK